MIKTLVDFSDRRPLIWRETSHPEVYRLHSLTAIGADVTEGVPVSWSRDPSDWSEPGLVRLRQIDSNIARLWGTISHRITPTPGGCHIECDRRRTFIGLRGHLLGWLMVVFGAGSSGRSFEPVSTEPLTASGSGGLPRPSPASRWGRRRAPASTDWRWRCPKRLKWCARQDSDTR